MFYIPNDWLVDIKNHEKVHNILNEIHTDLNHNELVNSAIGKLKKIGETVIIEKLKDGSISIN